jgi:serine O-acetyltransferase
MSGRGTTARNALKAFQADLARYVESKGSVRQKIRGVLEHEALLPIALYRAGTWIYGECPRPAAALLKLLWKPANAFVSTLLDTHLSVTAEIGPGLYLGHHGGLWVNPAASIGANCNLGQGVIIGMAGSAEAAPTLGDRVWVGPHAVITGAIRVGDESVVGANSLVATDVPPKGLVVGVPARLLGYSGSAHLIRQTA